MSLQDTLKDLRKQVSEIDTVVPDDHVEEEVQAEEVVEAVVEEVKEEAAPTEAEKEENKEATDEQPKLDDSAYARLRREKAAAKKEAEDAKRQAEELRERLEKLESAQRGEIVTEEAAPIPDRELEEIKAERQIQRANEEFGVMEQEYAANDPNYAPLAIGYKLALYQANKMKNPDLSHDQLVEVTKREILFAASKDVQAGKDPAVELYERAKRSGVQPWKEEKAEEVKEEAKKPNLDVIAKNRARNAGMVGAKGASEGGQMTAQAALDLTSEEWAKLPKAERMRLMRGG